MIPRFLYVDFAPAPGGSVQSLLLLLQHLPRQLYEPLVLVSPTVASLPAVRALGLSVFSYDAGQGTAVSFRVATGKMRASAAAGRVRTSRGLGMLWRWGSTGRRLWYRARPAAAFVSHLITEHQVDVVHLNDALPLAEPGILAAWRSGRPSIVTVRSFTPLDSVHRRLSRLPAAGIFTAEVLRLDQHRQGARFRREEIIPNAIDPAPYAQPPDPAGVRAEFHLPAQARIAIVAGRLMRRKGLDVFIQALAHLLPAHPDLYGLIVGEVDPREAGLKEELLGLAEGLGVAGQIRFTGYRDDVPRLLQASDLLCFVPTAPEPFGRTLIEAMAAGLPVIGGNNGGIPEIVCEGETGLLVPPSDPSAQARAMQRLLDQPDLAQALGRAGRYRVADRYSIAGQVDQLTALYETILADSPRLRRATGRSR